MNETVIQGTVNYKPAAKAPASKKKSWTQNAMYWYTILAALITAGWLVSDRELINPEEGIGYWLGIVGGSLMLALLLYPLRKRFRVLHIFGPTRAWFRLHMILGLVGPLFILYHCNFRLGSFNSQVALYCMLLVAGSGIVGRHFYARIHRGLYGQKTSLKELQGELAASLEKSHGLANLTPQLVTKLDALATDLQGDAITQSIGIGRSLHWTFTHRITHLSLWWTSRRELKAAARTSEPVAKNIKRLKRSTSAFIGSYMKIMGRTAQFTFYERLFALWHVLHLPIFIMMVLSAIAHVVAVHMY